MENLRKHQKYGKIAVLLDFSLDFGLKVGYLCNSNYSKGTMPSSNLLSNRFLAWSQSSNIPVIHLNDARVKIRDPQNRWWSLDLAKAINKYEFTSSNRNDALRQFHRITQTFGYGCPIPENRVGKPSKRASYKSEEFLVAIRHNEFRQAHNCSPAKFTLYKDIVRQRAKKFWYFNAKICQTYGLDYEDLVQYANCWLVNFCGLYERPDASKGDDNRRLLQNYLKQRFAELYATLQKKCKSISVEKESYLATQNDPVSDTDALESALGEMAPDEAREKLESLLNSGGLDKETAELARIYQRRLTSTPRPDCTSPGTAP